MPLQQRQAGVSLTLENLSSFASGSNLSIPESLLLPETPVAYQNPTPLSMASFDAVSQVSGPAEMEEVHGQRACSCPPTPPPSEMALPASPASSSTTVADMSVINEEIYSIIEQAVEHTVEHKMSDALAPLRLNVAKIEDSLRVLQGQSEGLFSLASRFNRENTDLGEQNETLSRQLDLHWQRIEQHTKTYHSMTDTHNSLLQTESTNLAMTANLVSQLSQIIVNLPTAINTIVQHTVYQHTDAALDASIQIQADFLSSIERNLSASARYAAAHPELMPPRGASNNNINNNNNKKKKPKTSGRRGAAGAAQATNAQGLRARVKSTFRKVLKKTN